MLFTTMVGSSWVKRAVMSAVSFVFVCAAPGCFVEDGSGEDDADEEETSEATSELRSGCVQSNFNCRFPDHPYDHVDRNRFFTANGNIKWSIAKGTVAVDGRGHLVGEIASSQIEINYGQRKKINGKSHVFGFRFTLKGNVPASAWVPEDAVRGETKRMPTVSHNFPNRPDGRSYVITGGDPKKFRDSRGVDYRISTAGTGNLEANDYLVRPSGTVHLLYNVPGFQIGGVATDTLRADKGTVFVRTKGVRSITVPTRSPSGAAAGPDMRFIYGRVGNRWGWIALDALRPA